MLVTSESTCSSVTLYTSFSQARTNQGTGNISEYSLRQVEDSLRVYFFFRKMAAVLQRFIKENQWRVTKYPKVFWSHSHLQVFAKQPWVFSVFTDGLKFYPTST